MDQLFKQYQTFFLIYMDEESLESFSLPAALEPSENPNRFNRICFLFILPEDNVLQASESRLPAALRR